MAFVKRFFRVAESQAASAQLPGQVDPAAVDAVTRVKEKHESRLLGVPGVVGVGVGLSEEAPQLLAELPSDIFVPIVRCLPG